MASIAYIFLVVISTYQIVAGNDIVNVLRSIAEEAVPQERKVAPASKPSQQPLVIIIGDGLLNQVHHHQHARPAHPPHRPRAVVPRPKEYSSQQAGVISQVLALLQGKQQAKYEAPVTDKPRIAHDPVYNLLKNGNVHSPVVKALLRYSNRVECEKKEQCQSQCKEDDGCRDECDQEYQCERKTTPQPDDYCDACEEKPSCERDTCGQGSTKGYTDQSAEGCKRC